MGPTAQSLHRDAIEETNRGELIAAQRMLRRAGSLAADDDLKARITGTMAVVQARMGSVGPAESLCAEALRTPGLTPETVAVLEGQMGVIAGIAGRLDDSDHWLSRAIARISAPEAKANLLMNRSVLGMERRDLDRSAADAALAADIYLASGRRVDAAEARHNLGYVDLLRGDLVGALSRMTSARATLAEASRASAAVADADRAEVLREAGLIREAEGLLTEAAGIFGSVRMKLERGQSEFALARSLLSHDPPRAAAIAATAARRFRALDNTSWALRADAVNLRARSASGPVSRQGRVSNLPRPPRAAEVEATVAALEARGLRDDASALRLSYEIWLARHGHAPARSAAVRVTAAASLDVRLLAHEVRAIRAQSRDRHSEARRHARAGLDELFEWQRQFGSLDLQTSVVWHGNGLIGAGIRSAVRSGRPEVVFEWSERARHLNLQVVPLRPPPDAGLAADLSELRLLRAEDGAGGSDPRAVEVQNRVRQRQWSGTPSAAIRPRVTLSEAQGALDDATAILAYVYTGRTVELLGITSAAARRIELGAFSRMQDHLRGLRADLDMAAAMQHGPLASTVRRSLAQRLGALSEALLAPALELVGDRRLVLTAPGVLNGIPWAMLPALRGRVITLAASVSHWVHSRPRAGFVPRAPAFAVGPRVPRASEEVRTAAAAWREPIVIDPASIADVAHAAAGADVLHVAAHGRHSAENPMFSGLELADGTLFGYDIDLIEKVPDTVVLSACEVGRSSVRWGEEAVGMTRVWLHAGTRSVVAAPVVVADDDACELLGAMHEGLAAGVSPSEALAAASERTGIVAPFQVHGAGF
ncbi:CHAT domain-containing protein [Microbacterium yannicii]|uniref:CHAT domain-containing protein n=1 Tax=Microbacterium yannicii TaxID=671622 RepID=UPI00030CC65A|nr:CHAT domain-containing protein [Microbacterium yannicii]